MFFVEKEADFAKKKGRKSLGFDINVHRLKELFCKGFDVEEYISCLEFSKMLSERDLPIAIKTGHEIIRTQEFDRIFNLILDDLEVIFGPIAYQSLPTFRIQLNNNRSEHFHTDEISSGHPDEIINVWIPITDLNSDNTLYIVDDEDVSLKLKHEFTSERKSISWLNSRAMSYAKPWIGNYGDILFFDNNMLHGTIVNRSGIARASIDFRILPNYNNAKMNTKILGLDYLIRSNDNTSNNVKDDSVMKPAISLIYTNGDASHLSHPVQRAIINNYAKKNNFQIIRETAEWQTPHYPVIEEILETLQDMPILLCTEKSYQINGVFSEEYVRLENKMKNHSGSIYFCLENYRL